MMVRRLARFRDQASTKDYFADILNSLTGERLPGHAWRRALRQPSELEAAARATLRSRGISALEGFERPDDMELERELDAIERRQKRRAQRQVRPPPAYCPQFLPTLLMYSIRTRATPCRKSPIGLWHDAEPRGRHAQSAASLDTTLARAPGRNASAANKCVGRRWGHTSESSRLELLAAAPPSAGAGSVTASCTRD